MCMRWKDYARAVFWEMVPTEAHLPHKHTSPFLSACFLLQIPSEKHTATHAAKAIRLVAFINIFRTYYYTLIKYISYGARGVDGPPHGILWSAHLMRVCIHAKPHVIHIHTTRALALHSPFVCVCVSRVNIASARELHICRTAHKCTTRMHFDLSAVFARCRIHDDIHRDNQFAIYALSRPAYGKSSLPIT